MALEADRDLSRPVPANREAKREVVELVFVLGRVGGGASERGMDKSVLLELIENDGQLAR